MPTLVRLSEVESEHADIPDPRQKPSLSLEEAAHLFGIGRTLAYELARHGEFPVPVLRFGRRYRVPTAPVLSALGLEADGSEANP